MRSQRTGAGFVLSINIERMLRRALILVALAALALGLALWGLGRAGAATWIWGLGTLPVIAGLAISMLRDFAAGRVGVDAIALVSMAAALALGETLAGIVVAVIASARMQPKTSPSTRLRSAIASWCAPARSCPWTA